MGQPFFFHSDPDSFQSTFVVPQMPLINGTSVVFIMIDAKGRQGGSTSLLTVSQSDDSSCINSSTPHSTAEASTQTSTPSATSVSSTSSSVKSGEIAGTVIGGVALIGIILMKLDETCLVAGRVFVAKPRPIAKCLKSGYIRNQGALSSERRRVKGYRWRVLL